MGWGSLCFPEWDGGTERVRGIVVAVGAFFVSLDFFFVSLTLLFFFLFSLLIFGRKGPRRIYADLEILKGEEYTTILRLKKGS